MVEVGPQNFEAIFSELMEKTDRRIRWALVGASDIAKTRMIPAINAQPASSVEAVFSSNAERGKAFAEENGHRGSFVT